MNLDTGTRTGLTLRHIRGLHRYCERPVDPSTNYKIEQEGQVETQEGDKIDPALPQVPGYRRWEVVGLIAMVWGLCVSPPTCIQGLAEARDLS